MYGPSKPKRYPKLTASIASLQDLSLPPWPERTTLQHMLNEFQKFLFLSNAFALAVGVIIGGATSKLVSALVDDLIMPPIGMLMQGGDWRQAQIVLGTYTDASGKVTEAAIKYGHLMGSFIDFVIIAFVVFVITKVLLPPKKEEEAKA